MQLTAHAPLHYYALEQAEAAAPSMLYSDNKLTGMLAMVGTPFISLHPSAPQAFNVSGIEFAGMTECHGHPH